MYSDSRSVARRRRGGGVVSIPRGREPWGSRDSMGPGRSDVPEWRSGRGGGSVRPWEDLRTAVRPPPRRAPSPLPASQETQRLPTGILRVPPGLAKDTPGHPMTREGQAVSTPRTRVRGVVHWDSDHSGSSESGRVPASVMSLPYRHNSTRKVTLEGNSASRGVGVLAFEGASDPSPRQDRAHVQAQVHMTPSAESAEEATSGSSRQHTAYQGCRDHPVKRPKRDLSTGMGGVAPSSVTPTLVPSAQSSGELCSTTATPGPTMPFTGRSYASPPPSDPGSLEDSSIRGSEAGSDKDPWAAASSDHESSGMSESSEFSSG